MNEERSPEYGGFGSEPSTPLEYLERIIASLPPGDPTRIELIDLRSNFAEQEEMISEARHTIEKLDEVIKKVTSPANRIGTYLGTPNKETAQIVVGGSDYYCNVDPRINLARLKKGTRVLVNEAYVIVGDLGYDMSGPVTKITELLGPDRLRVGMEHGMQAVVLQRCQDLMKETLKVGDEIRVDPNYRVAIEVLNQSKSEEYYLETVPELPWEKVGGQEEALSAIKDAIELPLLHADLFAKFQHQTPKGFLLYGPPGCGKTLIGKATAYNLTRQLKEKTGEDMQQFFMHIKGPEILNMWVGESERMVREIFATAREKRKEGFLPFVFIDEAESILGTRRAGRYSNVLSTLVPMFCTEMDGIESLNEVVIILASNRADLIDPAILRPGRIDRKIKVDRPDREAAREIYRIYLSQDLPYDPELIRQTGGVSQAVSYLIDKVVEAQFSRRDENRFLDVILRSGKRDTLYRGDLVSGAIIASIVERTKELAIKRAISSMQEEGISEPDLLLSLSTEYSENDIFPPTDIVEDWLKLIDYESENVVKVSPVRGNNRPAGESHVI
ncbi:MAG: AAA family ATPase [Verrucomicrobia bacterium]|nr:AAA family ATPase [Verrucomicrobiota bacterium]MBV8377918.1 AAA family ATPase [Verrucomicrobiota bacterium]